MTKIMIIGQGGREHALAWKLSQEKNMEKVFVVPGNPGMDSKNVQSIVINTAAHSELLKFATENSIDLVIVGPEKELNEGLIDYFKLHSSIETFGPTKEAARLEASKIFSKKIMKEAKVPTAEFSSFTNIYEVERHLEMTAYPGGAVVKCDGLEAGKGVIVCESKVETFMASNKFISEGKEILIEERLYGKELSAFILVKNEQISFLGTACDHKRLKDGDEGPNTGGMGCYAPTNWISKEEESNIISNIAKPIINEMKKEGKDFEGVLFIGLMKTVDGLKVLEFNVRFGDPETQTLMPLIDEDLLPYLQGEASGYIKLKNQFATHVVKAAAGYPGTASVDIRRGDLIQITKHDGQLFFAGIKAQDNHYYTNGGRVLGLTYLSDSLSLSRENCYREIKKIRFPGEQYRLDIGRQDG